MPTLLTRAGKEEKEKRLKELKEVKLEENKRALKEARAQGDLSENAEYDAAKEQQVEIYQEIQELEDMLKDVQIIVESTDKNVVHIGGKVRLMDMEDGEEEVYEIVGTKEADPFENRISNECPVGKAVIGGKKDEVISVETEAGVFKYKIMEIIVSK